MTFNATGQTQSGPEVELTFDDLTGDKGTFTMTGLSLGPGSPVGSITGTWKTRPAPAVSPGQQIKNVMLQEIIESSPSSWWAAGIATAVPLFALIGAATATALGNTGLGRGIVLGLSILAVVSAIIAGFNLVSKNGSALVTFFLGLFSGMATVLLLVAKIFEMPGS